MKKVISVMLAFLLCFSFPASVSAAGFSGSMVQPFYDKAREVTSTLRINGTSAVCESTCKGESDVVKIVAVQTLEQQGFLGFWFTYNDVPWTKTVKSNMLAMSNTESGLSSGSYQLKTVFTLTDKLGDTETITVYSTVKTVS